MNNMASRSGSKGPSGFKKRLLKIPSRPTNKKNPQDAAKVKEQNDQYVNYVSNMIERRIHNLKYLEQVYHGSVLWLNTVRITEDSVKSAKHSKQFTIVRHFYNLGMSLAWVSETSEGHNFLRAVSTVLEEYKYYIHASSSVRNADIQRTATTVVAFDEKNTLGPDLQINNGEPCYKYFESLAVPFAVDFYEVVLTLLSVLGIVYDKMKTASEKSPNFLNACISIDKKITNLVLEYLINDLQKIAKNIIQTSLASFQPGHNSENNEYTMRDDDDEDKFEAYDEDEEVLSLDEVENKILSTNRQLEVARKSFAYRNHECSVVAKAIRGASRQLTAQACIIALLEEQIRLHENNTVHNLVPADQKEDMEKNFEALENSLTQTMEERERMSSNLNILQSRLQRATQTRDSEKPEFMQILKKFKKLEQQRDILRKQAGILDEE